MPSRRIALPVAARYKKQEKAGGIAPPA